MIVNKISTCPRVVIRQTALKAARNLAILENLKIIKKVSKQLIIFPNAR